MQDTNHPLVGKRIVKSDPQAGEVTTDLINRTLGTVEYVDANNWWFGHMSQRRNSWTVHHDTNMQITSVERH